MAAYIPEAFVTRYFMTGNRRACALIKMTPTVDEAHLGKLAREESKVYRMVLLNTRKQSDPFPAGRAILCMIAECVILLGELVL